MQEIPRRRCSRFSVAVVIELYNIDPGPAVMSYYANRMPLEP